MKFLADSSLGRLSKWLRILGYDTVYWHGEADRPFLRKAEREGRAVLTRRRDVLARQQPGIVLLVENDRVEDQLVEVLGNLNLAPQPEVFFTICLRCNIPLCEVLRDDVRSRIPDYVCQTQREFRLCPGCGRVYWSGTHRDRAMKTIASVLESIQRDKPKAASHEPQGE